MAAPRILDRNDRFRLRLARSSDPTPKSAKAKIPAVSTRGATVRGAMLKSAPRWHQRVTVKITYRDRFGNSSRAGEAFARSLDRQALYITRDDAGARADGVEPVPAFDAKNDSVDGRATVEQWQADRRYWKVIVSPENGNGIKDFRGYTREVMAAIEKDLLTAEELKKGGRLEWVASIHDDTDHRHSHVMLRGRIEDRDLMLNKAYLSHGIRARAAEVATRHLGYRMASDGPAVPDTDGIKTQRHQERDTARFSQGISL